MNLALRSIKSNSPSGLSIEDYISNAQAHFGADDIDNAITELTSAVDTLKSHQALVEQSVDTAITTLSTLGGRADPPHPKALALIKLRTTLKAK